MKKLLFAAYSLDIGGIETSLVTLLNYLIKQGYDVTLALERKEGMFLNDLYSEVKVIEYKPSQNKIVIFRKLVNLFKRLIFILKYKNKFDFSASYATYSLPSSFIARTASKNSALWVHSNYLDLFEKDTEKVRDFFENISYSKFNNIVFVSKKAKDDFVSVFEQMEDKSLTVNNLIDYVKIEAKSNETIEEKKDTRLITFLNIGRHDELEKKLTRLIESSKKLKQDGYNFRVLMVGDGRDTDLYKEKVREYDLERQIIFLGRKKNPYPYFKISDCVILTSEYEGYPVVYVESFVLGVPIITTDVSDSREDVEGKYGLVTKKEIEDIYLNMKKFIDEGFSIKEKFDREEFNKNILKKIENMF